MVAYLADISQNFSEYFLGYQFLQKIQIPKLALYVNNLCY